jgi:Neutral/alkaline non-lysosomal ceramidase, N-terminal
MRWLITLIALAPIAAVAAEPKFKAGVASVVITPSEPIWMAGYASRNKPAEGKEHDLLSKAVALEDSAGTVLVIVGTDLVGLPRSISEPVAREVTKRIGLPRERLMLTSSHTHCGPVVRDNLMDMYDMPAEMRPKVAAYGDFLQQKLIEVVVAAVKDLRPAVLHRGEGTARFAVNRRKPTPTGFANDANPEGPVDHSVPVLRVTTPEGKLRAVVFGYACHNTTMQYFKWSGDYAGFAQIELQQKHPEATALFFMGCGGDANPLPRSKLELCQKYGKELAVSVEEVLSQGKMTEITGSFTAKYAEIALDFGKLPSREQWTAEAASKNYILKTRATKYLKMLDAGQKVPERYPHYPIQVWTLGDLRWIALGGECVVDYSHRLKKELGQDHSVWITAYANDVMAYIPSERVLKEGGYEGESSMQAYGMPTKWAAGIEEKIVGKVKELAGK